MYKKELKKMHERVRFYNQKLAEFHRKIELIQRVDYIKMELKRIGNGRAFRYTVADYRVKDELEELFNVPFHKIKFLYLDMLNERNRICHKFTMNDWEDK